jgi:hypothetical protein
MKMELIKKNSQLFHDLAKWLPWSIKCVLGSYRGNSLNIRERETQLQCFTGTPYGEFHRFYASV